MLNRRELLQRAAVAAPVVMLGRVGSAGASVPGPTAAGRNLVIFITDQDRAIQHFPAGWAQRHLPGLTRLQRNGVTFDNAVCNSCMCSPSRATLLTGLLPAQHGVKYTLEEDMPDDQYPQVELSPKFKNIATVMAAAGYDVVYKGKFHLCKPAGSAFAPSDLEPYGFTRWNPPDAGGNQDIEQEGGGLYDHDGRYINGEGDAAAGQEGVLQFLRSRKPGDKPFCLIVSLVNPHDVLLYPRNYVAGGYDDSWLEGEVGLPATVNEDLSTKPTAQRQILRLLELMGRLNTPAKKRAYMNFYANLMKLADGYLVSVLDTLTAQGLIDDTVVIRTSDHGEMGLAHGGMRQKNFNAYEETLRVPLVYSNPQLFPQSRHSKALVSHVDLLPTLASLFGAPATARSADWAGVDYSAQVLGTSSRAVQSETLFTFDDVQAGQASGPYVRAPNHIVTIRESRWKLSEYFDATGKKPSQWELYDRRADPLERHNLAAPGARRTKGQQREYARLRHKLRRAKATRLRPLSSTPQPLVKV